MTQDSRNCNNIQTKEPSRIPNEGLDLAALKDLKADLEKVGRMIVNCNGEKILQRAHVLASINYLAPHVPSSVIHHLGSEIQERMGDKVKSHSQSLNDNPSMTSAQPLPRANKNQAST
jgi:hypothetical protein